MLQDNLDLDELATRKTKWQQTAKFYSNLGLGLGYSMFGILILLVFIPLGNQDEWFHQMAGLVLGVAFFTILALSLLGRNFWASLYLHFRSLEVWNESAPSQLRISTARFIWNWLSTSSVFWGLILAFPLAMGFSYWANMWVFVLVMTYFPILWAFLALSLQFIRYTLRWSIYQLMTYQTSPSIALSTWHSRFPKSLTFSQAHLHYAYSSSTLEPANKLAREYISEAVHQGNWKVLQISLLYFLNGLFWQEKYSESIPIYVALIKSSPASVDYAVCLARGYLAQNTHLQRATQWLKYANSTIVPGAYEHLHLIFIDSYAEARNGKLNEIGIQNIERNIPNLLQHDPIQSAYYYYLIGLTYKAGQMPEKARYYFQKAYNLDIPKYIGQAVWREMGRL